jgi:hypothetical protein
MTAEEVQGPTALIRPLWLDPGGLLTVPCTNDDGSSNFYFLFAPSVSFFSFDFQLSRFCLNISSSNFRRRNNATCNWGDDFKEKAGSDEGQLSFFGKPR